jgi:CubicO group peptidase (beta-lactamase class C family)
MPRHGSSRRGFIAVSFLLALFSSPSTRAAEQASLDSQLQPYLQQYSLPAVAAAVAKNGVIVAAGKAGTRRVGYDSPVTIDDRFHIGSDSKAFTALLAGEYVESGKLRWESTFADVFPELKGTADKEFAQITLQQLLSHSSGLADNKTFVDLIGQSFMQDGNLNEVRYWLLTQVATKPIDHPRGSKFSYCNLGYILVGTMLERVGGKSWEELVVGRILTPLSLSSAGFGPCASLGRLDGTLGHIVKNGKTVAMLPGPNGDNPAILGPAGTMHMSVLDFIRWVSWNAGEGRRGPALVSGATLKKLHTGIISTGARPNAAPGTPDTGEYAMGWGVLKLPWAAKSAVTHNGSNEMNLAMAIFWPDTDVAMVMMTNIGGAQADTALRAIAEQLYKSFGSSSPAEK